MASETSKIRAKARNLGFSFTGFCEVKQSPHFIEYLEWLERNQFGQLNFLNKDYVIRSRRNPRQLLKNAKSIIVLGVKYYHLPQQNQAELSDKGIIAAYAQYDDYHQILKSKAKKLIESINSERSEKINYRIYIDSGPLMEKDFAYSSGEGWIGNNSLFIHPEIGSFIFLCCIMTDIDLIEKTEIPTDLCDNCHLCEQACPTLCINGDHTIDASRCISYLTIEHKGVVPWNLRSQIGNHVFGCDICQNVCPHNIKEIENQSEIYFNLKKKNFYPIDLLNEMSLSEESFIEKYISTPIVRISHEQYLRNIIIAAGNTHNSKFMSPLSKLLDYGSEIIRIHAIWALGEIDSEECLIILRSHMDNEQNDLVKSEILNILQRIG